MSTRTYPNKRESHMPMIPKQTNPRQYQFLRSQHITSRHNFRWSNANVRSTLKRSIGSSADLPLLRLPFGPVLLGIRGLIPRRRNFFSKLLRLVSLVKFQTEVPSAAFWIAQLCLSERLFNPKEL